ncbi:MAG: DNA polymerase III subunit delta [Bacteroidaceae bacterium]|nr:DNA polymerase III subunit delta [Bacteroidaceae bacterium]
MAKSEGPNYKDIVRDVQAGKYSPVYCFMGDEDYYIDNLSQYIADRALKPEERDFNYDLLYGAETRANDIIAIARQFPMMAERRVVLVREFQALADKEALSAYVKNPNPTTILILCHKHGKLDARRALAQEIKRQGVLFESKRLYDRELPGFITKYMERKQKAIEPAAVQMLCDHVGSDLSRLVAEMDKLLMALPQGETRVGASLVEELTGVSKDFNSFELQNALAVRDVYKANQIVKYFDTNPRSFALQPTLASLFNFFSDVLLAYFATPQTDDSIAQYLGKSTWVARQALIPARRNYSGKKVMDIISEIRKTDGKSKGVGGCKTTPGDLLKELVFFILH